MPSPHFSPRVWKGGASAPPLQGLPDYSRVPGWEESSGIPVFAGVILAQCPMGWAVLPSGGRFVRAIRGIRMRTSATPNAACHQRVPNPPVRLSKASASSAQSADLFLPTQARLLPANRRPKSCSLHKARVVVAYASCRMGKFTSQRAKEVRNRPGGGREMGR